MTEGTENNPIKLPEVVVTASITNEQIKEIAERNGIEYAALKIFIEVESGGKGFGRDGKLLIQFEPSWFKKKAPYAPSGQWSVNKIDVQSKEWIAFNDAFAKDADAAMESTSIGLPQIMGLHWKRLGYSSVAAMWDEFKKGEYQQVEALAMFIRSDKTLLNALNGHNWHTVAVLYNGSGYKALAAKIGREPYDISLRKAYEKYKK